MKPLVLVECPTIGELNHLWVRISFKETECQVIIFVRYLIAMVLNRVSTLSAPKIVVESISNLVIGPATEEFILIL